MISEDWPQRMLPPRKGDYTRIPLTPAARKVADTWDPARDEAAGEQCKGYTAAGITRMPGRIRLSWQDDYTMKMELEAGSQTRLFHFRSGQPPAEPSWQGYSVADWQYTRQPPRSGELRVITNRIRPGYLRKNGVPLSGNTTVTEYLPPVHRAERRRLAHRRDGSHRPGESAAAVRPELAFQEAARRRRVQTRALFRAVIGFLTLPKAARTYPRYAAYDRVRWRKVHDT